MKAAHLLLQVRPVLFFHAMVAQPLPESDKQVFGATMRHKQSLCITVCSAGPLQEGEPVRQDMCMAQEFLPRRVRCNTQHSHG